MLSNDGDAGLVSHGAGSDRGGTVVEGEALSATRVGECLNLTCN
jgi:hypothetical protein